MHIRDIHFPCPYSFYLAGVAAIFCLRLQIHFPILSYLPCAPEKQPSDTTSSFLALILPVGFSHQESLGRRSAGQVRGRSGSSSHHRLVKGHWLLSDAFFIQSSQGCTPCALSNSISPESNNGSTSSPRILHFPCWAT